MPSYATSPTHFGPERMSIWDDRDPRDRQSDPGDETKAEKMPDWLLKLVWRRDYLMFRVDAKKKMAELGHGSDWRHDEEERAALAKAINMLRIARANRR